MKRLLAIAMLLLTTLSASADQRVAVLPGMGVIPPTRQPAVEVGIVVAFVTSATSAASTITAPASINAGDLLVLVDIASTGFGTPPTDVVPTEFTGIGTETLSAGTAATNQRIRSSYKIAEGDEDSASITGMDGTDGEMKILLQYRGTPAIGSLTVSSFITSDFQSGDPTQQTLTASGGTSNVLGNTVFNTLGSGNDIDPRTTSITPDEEVLNSTGNYRSAVHSYYQSGSASDYTWDMDDEGANNMLSGWYFYAFAE